MPLTPGAPPPGAQGFALFNLKQYAEAVSACWAGACVGGVGEAVRGAALRTHKSPLAPRPPPCWRRHAGTAAHCPAALLLHCAPQAHAFQEGLKLNPADKVMKQGFWDAIGLLSQTRAPIQ